MRGKRALKLRWRSRISDKGFTLLEVLLAVVIGAMVLTVLYASFFQIIKAKESAENTIELYHEANTVFSRMTKDLQAAYLRGKVFSDSITYPYSSFVGAKEGDQSFMRFTSLSREPGIKSKDSDQAEISYYLEPIPQSDLFLLIRSENPRIGTDSGGIQYPISEHIVEFNLTYISDNVEGPVEEWDSSQTGSLPKAVQVTLTMRSPRGENVTFSSLIGIPVAN